MRIRSLGRRAGFGFSALVVFVVGVSLVVGRSAPGEPLARDLVAPPIGSLGDPRGSPAPPLDGDLLAPGQSTPSNKSSPRFVPRELLVRFRRGTTSAERADVRRHYGARLKEKLLVPRLQLLELGGRTSELEAAAALRRDPRVESANLNDIGEVQATPNDPRFGKQWGLNNTGQSVNGYRGGTPDADIDAPEAWDHGTGSRNVTVAVVDTGVDWSHSDLDANIWTNPGETGGGRETNGVDDDGNGFVDDWHGWDFQGNDNNPKGAGSGADKSHGTHVSGIIGAEGNNGDGVTGVNWKVKIMPVRVCNADGDCPRAKVINGLAYAVRNGADVANISLAFYHGNQEEENVITGAPNTLFAVAAGNDYTDVDKKGAYARMYPCKYTAANLICVANSSHYDELVYGSSNFGAVSVDLAAPGLNILSTLPNDRWGFMSGTSMASPHVAGAAALYLARYPGASVAQVKQDMLDSVDVLPALDGRTATGGRLNLHRLVSEPSSNTLAEVTPSGELRVTAAPGQANNIVVTQSGGAFAIADSGARGVTAGPGCDAVMTFDVTVTCDAGPVNHLLIDANDRKDVVKLDDTVTTGATIIGGPGDDTLTGGNGDDWLSGGDDIDTLDGGGGGDQFTGADGIDTVTYEGRTAPVIADIDYEERDDGENCVTGPGPQPPACEGDSIDDRVENITGGRGNDTLIGDWLDNTLKGGPGDDTLRGALGPTNLSPGGNDHLYGEDNNDTLDGGPGSLSNPGNDTLDGGGGTNTADYSQARYAVRVDLSIAGPQDTGGAGTDTLTNIDDLIGSSPVTDSSRDDTLTGDSGPNVLRGEGGGDTLTGGAGDDDFFGGPGSDEIYARDGIAEDPVDCGPDGGFAQVDGNDVVTGCDRVDLPGSPRTTIIRGPSGTTFNPAPTFEFTSNEPGSTFECRVYLVSEPNPGSPAGCSSPHKTASLADGTYTFEVRAIDAAGNPGQTPASQEFTVRSIAQASVVEVQGSVLTFTAASYTQNDVTISSSGSDYTITDDTGAPLSAVGPECSGTTSSEVTCSGTGVERINVDTGDLDDTVHVNAATDATILGGDGDDHLYGGSGNDDLNGGGGSDTLDGGPGGDRLRDSGSNIDGTDTVTYEQRSEPVTADIDGGSGDDGANCGPGEGPCEGDAIMQGIERIVGGKGGDRLTGNYGDNTLEGGPGNDTLDGGPFGDDILNGGGGSDTADYSRALDAVRVDLSKTGPQVVGLGADTLTNIDNVIGSSFDDTLIGNSGANDLSGGPGVDTVDYSARRSSLRVILDDRANDGGSGERDNVREDVENVIAGSGNDRLYAQRRGAAANTANRLDGGPGKDRLKGYGGADHLYGGEGSRDSLDGGDGGDYLYDRGPAGERNTLKGGNDNDHLYGGLGDDKLIGGNGDDVLDARGPGRDRVSGGRDNDTIYARDGVYDAINCSSGTEDWVQADETEEVTDKVSSNCEQRDTAPAAAGGAPQGSGPAPSAAAQPPAATGTPATQGSTVSIRTTAARATRGGVVRLRLRCSSRAASCRGTLRLRTARALASSRKAKRARRLILARRRFRVPAATTRTVRVRLTRAGRGMLRRRRRLRVRVEARSRDAGRIARARTVTLR